jgi:hypothetical protein
VTYSEAAQLTDAELAAEVYALDIACGFERPLTREADDAWRLGLFPEVPSLYGNGPTNEDGEPIDTYSHVGDVGARVDVPDAFERYYG